MRGYVETYAGLVEEVLDMTDDEILEWLSQFNVDFATATQEQRESFLYGWKLTIVDWRNAMIEAYGSITPEEYVSKLRETYGAAGTPTPAVNSYSVGLASNGFSVSPTSLLTPELGQYQTIIDAIANMNMLHIGGLGNMNNAFAPNAYGSLNIESIDINVETLDSDADYEEVARKVGEVLQREITRTMPVGGVII